VQFHQCETFGYRENHCLQDRTFWMHSCTKRIWHECIWLLRQWYAQAYCVVCTLGMRLFYTCASFKITLTVQLDKRLHGYGLLLSAPQCITWSEQVEIMYKNNIKINLQ
jgi:hypothetical protein